MIAHASLVYMGSGNQMDGIYIQVAELYCMDNSVSQAQHKIQWDAGRIKSLMKQKDAGIATFCPMISLWYTGFCYWALSTETLFFTPNNSVLNFWMLQMHEVIPKTCLKFITYICRRECKFTIYKEKITVSWMQSILQTTFCKHAHTFTRVSKYKILPRKNHI